MKLQEKEAIAKKIIDMYVDEERMENAQITIMMSNLEYIKWIIDFTKDKEGFLSEDYNYYKGNDKENVEKLNLFYKGVDRYAKSNHIYPEFNDFSSFYKVSYNNCGFQVGMAEGQGTSEYYLTKISLANNKGFIDFSDIVSNKKQDNVDFIEFALKNLANEVTKAYKVGVPKEAILNTVNSAIEELTSNKDNFVRKLISK